MRSDAVFLCVNVLIYNKQIFLKKNWEELERVQYRESWYDGQQIKTEGLWLVSYGICFPCIAGVCARINKNIVI